MPIVWINEKPLPIVRAGDGPGILYNRDTTRPLYIGNDSSIVHGNVNSASILDPLASLFVEGDVDVWMSAPVGTLPDNAVPLDFIHSGRSQHFPSASVLSEPLNALLELGGGNGESNDALLQQILEAIQALQPAPPNPGGITLLHGMATLVNGVATVTVTVPATGVAILVSYAGMTAEMGILSATANPTTNFVINSTNPNDNSNVYWTVITS